jgi:hypothetical protein
LAAVERGAAAATADARRLAVELASLQEASPRDDGAVGGARTRTLLERLELKGERPLEPEPTAARRAAPPRSAPHGTVSGFEPPSILGTNSHAAHAAAAYASPVLAPASACAQALAVLAAELPRVLATSPPPREREEQEVMAPLVALSPGSRQLDELVTQHMAAEPEPERAPSPLPFAARRVARLELPQVMTSSPSHLTSPHHHLTSPHLIITSPHTSP